MSVEMPCTVSYGPFTSGADLWLRARLIDRFPLGMRSFPQSPNGKLRHWNDEIGIDTAAIPAFCGPNPPSKHLAWVARIAFSPRERARLAAWTSPRGTVRSDRPQGSG